MATSKEGSPLIVLLRNNTRERRRTRKKNNTLPNITPKIRKATRVTLPTLTKPSKSPNRILTLRTSITQTPVNTLDLRIISRTSLS